MDKDYGILFRTGEDLKGPRRDLLFQKENQADHEKKEVKPTKQILFGQPEEGTPFGLNDRLNP